MEQKKENNYFKTACKKCGNSIAMIKSRDGKWFPYEINPVEIPIAEMYPELESIQWLKTTKGDAIKVTDGKFKLLLDHKDFCIVDNNFNSNDEIF